MTEINSLIIARLMRVFFFCSNSIQHNKQKLTESGREIESEKKWLESFELVYMLIKQSEFNEFEFEFCSWTRTRMTCVHEAIKNRV